jgi:hypothetical protein
MCSLPTASAARAASAATAVGAATAAGAAKAASAAPGTTGCRLPVFGPGPSYRPVFEAGPRPAQVNNPWFPLRRGTTWIYTGIEGGRPAVDVVVVSRHTRTIDGVRTRVVHDRLYHGGHLTERTRDYFAQDRCGNVWYFGEDTAELDAAGHVTSREGTWHAGRDGAQPGVFMPAHPRVGQRFRQEWLAGQAEDVFRIVAVDGRRLRTRETSALEPGVIDAKRYVRGIGETGERGLRGDHDRLTLDVVLH